LKSVWVQLFQNLYGIARFWQMAMWCVLCTRQRSLQW